MDDLKNLKLILPKTSDVDEETRKEYIHKILQLYKEVPNKDVYVLIEDYVDLTLFSAENNDELV